jgi:uncharacterized membrane protein YfcA
MLVGLTGLGGGVILLPLLIFVLHVSPIGAVGSGAVFSAITKTGAGFLHWRQGTLDWELVRYLAAGSVPGALAGVGFLFYIRADYGEGVNDFLTRAIGILLIVIPVLLLLEARLERQTGNNLRSLLPGWVNRRNGAVITGLIGGFLVGVTSVGSGSIILMMLLLFSRRPPNVLVGTDIVHAVILTGVAGLFHLGIGTVNLHLVGLLLIGSLPGSLLGVRLGAYLPVGWLRWILILLLFATGVKMLWD